MTYRMAMEKVNNRLRFGMKPGLGRVSALLRLLGNPQEHFKIIHIAGTNGKGSTCALTASVLTECGYKTGLYTSPYVVDFRERFQIDREMISQEALIGIVEQVDLATNYLKEDATEFEFITAVAFLWFYQSGCDYVVLEVGLGGQFDATNVISVPEVAVITQIDLDHTAILGDTVEKIAFEKAGIIKSGGKLITYPLQPYGAEQVIRKICAEKQIEIVKPEVESIEIVEANIQYTRFSYDGLELMTPFAGEHQVLNAVTAYCALRGVISAKTSMSDENLKQGFRKARMPARMEVLSKKPFIIVDGGHNPGCARALRKLLEDFTQGYRRVAVMGMMADKDVEQMLQILGPIFSKIIAVTPSQPRAMPAEVFAQIAKNYCSDVEVFEDLVQIANIVLKGDVLAGKSLSSKQSDNSEFCQRNGVNDLAYSNIGLNVKEKTVTVVCGSFFLASDFRNIKEVLAPTSTCK